MKYIKSDNINFALSNLPQLVFEVTDACNLQCKYCAYGDLYDDYDERTDNTLSIKKAIKLIDYLADFWNSGRNSLDFTKILLHTLLISEISILFVNFSLL
jgi:uncharacterized protein